MEKKDSDHVDIAIMWWAEKTVFAVRMALRRKYAVRGIQQVVYSSYEVRGACGSGKRMCSQFDALREMGGSRRPVLQHPALAGPSDAHNIFKSQPPTCSSSSHHQRTTLFRRSTPLQLPFIRGCCSPSILETYAKLRTPTATWHVGAPHFQSRPQCSTFDVNVRQ